jgi:hypothetical protein
MKCFEGIRWGVGLAAVLSLFVSGAAVSQKTAAADPPSASLLPQFNNWKLSEAPREFRPATLFEYIDGAAEIYLSYDFLELVVAQDQEKATKASITVEIYDMGAGRNAFGIYSAERYPDSRFLAVGNQGYLDEGTLNLLAGRYYIKLLCFEGGAQSPEFLQQFAKAISGKVKDPGRLPTLLQVFPKDALIPNSEKFILRNFLGFKFLGNGFTASYKAKDLEFDCFFLEGTSEVEAGEMLKQYLGHFAKSGQAPEKQSYGYHARDPYLKHVFLAQVGKYLCGVTKIKDGAEATGSKYLEALATALKEKKDG